MRRVKSDPNKLTFIQRNHLRFQNACLATATTAGAATGVFADLPTSNDTFSKIFGKVIVGVAVAAVTEAVTALPIAWHNAGRPRDQGDTFVDD